MRRVRIGAALLLAAAGCATPAARFANRAATLGLRAEVVTGTKFLHVAFHLAGRSSRTLHVYLDGDGTPWAAGRPAQDPTPRNPLVLGLMALDPTPSLYLGRPCYHGFAGTPPCTPLLWTFERYSEAVVDSMRAALRRILQGGEFDRVIWLGHSGGGVLAFLLAPSFPETAGLITVAANLDIDAWADLHGYPRLRGSPNPASQPPIPPTIYQRHYVGGEDRIVPREVVARGPIPAGTITVIPRYDHICCWESFWPAVLSDVERATRPAGR